MSFLFAKSVAANAERLSDAQWPLRWRRSALAVGSMLGLAAWLTCFSAAFGWDGLDAGLLEVKHERELATRQLELARADVEKARAGAAAAKREMDAFLAQHFDDLRSDAADSLPEPIKSRPPAPSASNAQAEHLNREIKDLKGRRKRLLERVTAQHPEVVDIEAHLEELSQRLSALTAAAKGAEDLSAGNPTEGTNIADPRLVEELKARRERREAALALYEQYTLRWQAAEREREQALEAEERAAERLAAIKLPTPRAPKPPKRDAERQAVVSEPPQRGSQPLALAAFLIALAVAALAAVKLARSNSDSLFASAEDVAAALALPVVGIFPAADAIGLSHTTVARVARGSVLVAQIVLAVVVFALIAYCVQNPALMWQVCTHPIESAAGVGRLLSGQ